MILSRADGSSFRSSDGMHVAATDRRDAGRVSRRLNGIPPAMLACGCWWWSPTRPGPPMWGIRWWWLGRCQSGWTRDQQGMSYEAI